MNEDNSNGRTVLITGAGGGIGRKLVTRFLTNNDTVIATDSSTEALTKLEQALDGDPTLVTAAADITDEDDVSKLADVIGEHSGIDILINGAGFFPFTPFSDMTSAQWRTVIDINLTGNFLITHGLLPLMKERGWGRIINVGSASIFSGVAGQAHYVAAKAGLVGLTRSLAHEVGADGITVNLITPGLTLTQPVVENFDPELTAAQRTGRALNRDQLPDDLVGPVFFLASPDSDFITGQTLNVDGGMFMH